MDLCLRLNSERYFSRNNQVDFNFPPRRGTGISRQLTQCSADAIDLLNQLCVYDPDHRLTAVEALRHPYFDDLRLEKRWERGLFNLNLFFFFLDMRKIIDFEKRAIMPGKRQDKQQTRVQIVWGDLIRVVVSRVWMILCHQPDPMHTIPPCCTIKWSNLIWIE